MPSRIYKRYTIKPIEMKFICITDTTVPANTQLTNNILKTHLKQYASSLSSKIGQLKAKREGINRQVKELETQREQIEENLAPLLAQLTSLRGSIEML
jgi:chromosome segregation ATPase